jgi:hypothetical protein
MIPPDIHKELKLHAVVHDTTLQDCIMQAIKEHLQNKCKTEKQDHLSTLEEPTVEL